MTGRPERRIDGPKSDVHGDFRVRLRRYAVGRKIQVVVALNVNKCTVVYHHLRRSCDD
ncbi:MAG: hypothetical protein J4F49_09530 [Rhodobacteraceae bacterium]|nr:hypothetical protein [Paracoccaceae bacterium]